MSDDRMVAFRASLSSMMGSGDLVDEVLRHELWSSVNRSRLTGLNEGLSALNTEQLATSVAANEQLDEKHPWFIGLLCSAAIDGREDILDAALEHGLAADWEWIQWSRAFTGDESALMERLSGIKETRQWAAALCLAGKHCPSAIGPKLLQSCSVPHLALVFHRIADLALSAQGGAEHAVLIGDILASHPIVLLASDADALLARLIAELPGEQIPDSWEPLRPAFGDRSNIALARLRLNAGAPADAWDLVKDIRLLSPWYDDALLVAVLSQVEQGDVDGAAKTVEKVADVVTKLRLQVRIDQERGDAFAEAKHMEELLRYVPREPGIFLGLLSALHRSGNGEKLKRVAAEHRADFDGDGEVLELVDRLLALA